MSHGEHQDRQQQATPCDGPFSLITRVSLGFRVSFSPMTAGPDTPAASPHPTQQLRAVAERSPATTTHSAANSHSVAVLLPVPDVGRRTLCL